MGTPNLSALSHEELEELRLRLEMRFQYEASSEEERKRIQYRSSLESDFALFVRTAWPILEPGNTLSWSWHYDLICEYLMLAHERKVKRLIINIPPRTLKSIIVTVMFPVWVWTHRPNESFACASYADGLSEELSVKRRRLIQSEWFKRTWGDKIWLQKDQNQKSKFQNNFQAQMFATSVGGTMHGIGGNFLIVDDAIKPDEVMSEAAIGELHRWFDGTWRQRLNQPALDVMIIVEQRTGEMDLTGHCLSGDKVLHANDDAPEWTHLCMPLEADEEEVDPKTLEKEIVFPISGRIHIRRLGDILQPDRFPSWVVAAKKIIRMTWATQYQQRPSPLEGNLIKRSDVMYYGGMNPTTGENDEPLPDAFDLIITSTDASFKDEKKSDYVCVGTIGVKGPRRYILEVVTKHLDSPATIKEINRQRQSWRATTSLIEDKANGTAIIKEMKRKVTGIIAIEPEGGKFSRFCSAVGEWQANCWYVSRTAAWTEPFVEHITKFPGIKNDDDCDMMSQGSVWLQKQNYLLGLSDFLREKEAEMKRTAKENASPSKTKEIRDGERVTKVALKNVEAKVETSVKQAVDHPQGIAKPDVDDSTPRCSNCNSTILIRIAGGIRCQNCGHQQGQSSGFVSTTSSPQRNTGVFRK